MGLSKSTVSRAISGKGRVSSETRRRVSEYIKLHNYRPNSVAKSLSDGRTYNIAVVIHSDVSGAAAPFFQDCLMGICRECAVNDFDAVVVTCEGEDDSQLRRVLENRKVDGVIITRPTVKAKTEQLVHSFGIPCVVTGNSTAEYAFTVDSDHVHGCKELTAYLLRQNSPDKTALILGSSIHTVNRSRYTGFVEAYKAIGAVPPENLIFTDIETPAQFDKAFSTIMKNEPRCVICGDDIICMKLLGELSALGIKVPDDIKVASFYNSPYLEHYIPPITSLIFNANDLGSQAAAVLMSLIAGDTPPKSTVRSFEMLVRKSTL
ncbi:MAG: LacI family transcriptional regulator [Oscillospiraceae bacterium]|nr:LacI family transcriptional regulator [Oscillospiraceae bacterium]